MGLRAVVVLALGLAAVPTVHAVAPSPGASQVSAGDLHSCAVAAGGIQCWGSNASGQLGIGTLPVVGLVPVEVVPPGSGATAVAAGTGHTCAVISGGVKCWGLNLDGQLGNGTNADSAVPVTAIAAGSGATAIAAGASHSCAVVSGGVQCWGAGGRLGIGTLDPSTIPLTAMPPGSAATAVAAGERHTCAVSAGGVYCWGFGDDGQLGNGSTAWRGLPGVTIAAGSGATDVAAGAVHSCAVVSGGVRCWGRSFAGQLGTGNTAQSLVPVTAIAAGSNATGIAAGLRHSCAAVAGGVQCWGDANNGQLGIGTTVPTLAPLTTLPAGSNVTAIAAGSQHSCAVVSGGVQCWGDGLAGRLGDGQQALQLRPVDARLLVPLPVFATGVDGSGVPLAGGSVDPHYTLESSDDPAFPGSDAVVASAIPDGQWLANGPTSKWIAPSAFQQSPPTVHCNPTGTYTYRTTFDLSSLDPATVTLRGRWAVDDAGTSLRLNGVATGFTAAAFDSFASFTLSAGFIPGVNTLDFVTVDNGCPGGLRVELSGLAAPVPGPDRVPDPFSFAEIRDVPAATTQTSQAVTPTGYDGAADVSVTDGQFSIGCAAGGFTALAATIEPGQSVCVRHTSSANPLTFVTTTLAIGGVTATFTSQTGLTPQAIDFPAPPARPFGSAPFTVSATGGGSGNPVAFSSLTPSVCTVSGSTVTLLSPGDCTVAADQAGSALFAPAPQVTRTFAVAKSAQTIVFAVLPERAPGMQFTAWATASSGLPVSLTSFTPSVCSVAGKTVTALAVGNCVITASQGGDALFNSAPNVTRNVEVAAVLNPNDVVSVAAGADHSCAATAAGAVRCWGSNVDGQLGDGTGANRDMPVDVAGIANATSVAAGSLHSCALRQDGTASCWGRGIDGQLGHAASTSSPAPVAVSGLAGAVAVAAGAFHNCAVTASGAALCWGRGNSGQLGHGAISGRNSATGVLGLETGVARVSAGDQHSCAVTAAGGAKCWGSNAQGQLGDGTTATRPAPVDVSGLSSGVAAIAAGTSHTCALTHGGAVKCWGDNSAGQLGDGSTTASPVPVDVPGLAGVAAISAGKLHTCAVTANGAAKCWGANAMGQLGDRTRTDRPSPGDVFILSGGTVAISAGSLHNCALTTLGAVSCWGDDGSGQLGDGTAPGQLFPVTVVGLGGVDGTPDALANVAQVDVPIGSLRSFTITPTGFADLTGVEVAGGEHSIGCTGIFGTTVGGAMRPGASVCVRHVASSSYLATVTTTITIGGVSATLASTTAAPPALALSATSLAFGSQDVGSTATPLVATVTNQSSVHVALGLAAETTGDFSIASTTCPATLAAGASCAISVAFTPLAAGTRSGELRVSSANGIPALPPVALSGTGVAPPPPPLVPALATSVDALDFGGQSISTTSPAQPVLLTNSGTGTLAIASVAASPHYEVAHDCATLAAGASCTAQVSFAPNDSGALPGTLAITSAAGTRTIALAGIGERSLVTHYYRAILRRAPDAGGKAFWDSEAARVAALGANVNETWFSMAQSFFASAEYVAFARDDAGFVTDLYVTFFDRPPDAAGLAFWSGQLAQGMPREVMLASFMFSAEFVGFTRAIFGNTPTRAEVDVVLDFYRGLLSRLPDEGGFGFWRQRFRTAQCAGGAAVTAEAESISSQFATSGEYAARARTHSQYVGDLYNAFLRRGGDLAGVQFWISQLATGAQTREQVRKAFVASPEFQARVLAVIAQGCLP